MYRDDGFRFTPRPPPSPPVYRPSPVPVEVLPPPDPGAQPDYQRRFPIVQQPPARGVPMSPPTPWPLNPGRRPVVPIQRILNRVQIAAELLNVLNPPPGFYPQALLGGDWYRLCGRSAPIPITYTSQSGWWAWRQPTATTPFCGLSNQSMGTQGGVNIGWNNTADATTKTLYIMYKRLNTTLDRFMHAEMWTRDQNGPLPHPNTNMSDTYWTTRPTFPFAPTLPSVEGVIPLHIPWIVLPYVASSPTREVSYGDGNTGLGSSTVTGTIVSVDVHPVTGVDTRVRPGQPYVPNPRVATGIGTRELKSRVNMQGVFRALNLAWEITEGDDVVEALFKALPWARQREFNRWYAARGEREKSYAQYVYLRGLFVLRHSSELDLSEAVGNIIANAIEDALWGQFFRARSRLAARGYRVYAPEELFKSAAAEMAEQTQ